MPKYIKVLVYNEFSVFEVIEEYEKTIKCKLTVCENGYIVISKNNVISKADTIEKLCDGFYVDKCKEEFLYDEIFDECWYDFNSYFKECAKNGIDVYGFIKTDKGLIYVAKIDNDGKLVLI